MNVVLIAGAGVASLLAVAGAVLAVPRPDAPSFMGEDLGRIRSEALARYPIGTPIEIVGVGLTEAGFQCDIGHPPLETVTAPVLFCRSNGRSGGASPAVFITVVSRSAALTDFAVSNGLNPGEANALTPNGIVGRS